MVMSIGALCMRMRARALYTSNGLHHPPVAESQVQAAEARLGFQLPLVLRELYMTVANGADFFAPGCALFGIAVEHTGGLVRTSTLEGLVGNGSRPFDPVLTTALRHSRGSYVISDEFPKDFTILSPVGGDVWVVFDGITGHVYIRQDHYEQGKFVGGAFSFCADTVEEWLERTLADFPFEVSIAQYKPQYPLVPRLELASADDAGGNTEAEERVAVGHLSEGRQYDNARVPSQLASYFDPETAQSYLQLRARLKYVREEIVRQIYELDEIEQVSKQITIVRMIQELDVLKQATTPDDTRLTHGFARSAVMQSLADAESQVYRLELDATVL